MAHGARDRVTVDLRGLGERLRVQAAARQMATGAFVRRAVALQLDRTPDEPAAVVALQPKCSGAKITLRLPSSHAAALALRARQADVSQGTFVASLLDGHPPLPVPPDRAPAIAALVASTDQLAAMDADLKALTRLLRLANSTEARRYRGLLDTLSGDVAQHLRLAADLFGELVPSRRARAGTLALRRSTRAR